METPSVLFVCLANICRSPTAEAVFRRKAKAAGLICNIDSAGTRGNTNAVPPDKRSVKVGSALGYDFSGIRSRRVMGEDFEKFDYILAMDRSNYESLLQKSDPSQHNRIHLFMDFAEPKIREKITEVPDPFHGGMRGFEMVIQLIENASDGLVKHLQQ